MEKNPLQKYTEGLVRTIQANYHYLKETIDEFQEMCRMVSPEKNVPTAIIVDIREMYKEIRNRLAEIKAIDQLLQGKYRQYYRRDPQRDKEILEFGFIVKNCFSKFEYTMMQIEALKRLKEQSAKGDHLIEHFQWFRSKENQIVLIKNLRILKVLDYESHPEAIGEERRDLSGNRALTLFLFSGDLLSLDHLQSKIQLREHDMIERYDKEEIRGVLTHLRRVAPIELEKMFQRIMESSGLTKLKCLFLSIHSPEDLERDLLRLFKTTLQGMNEGELKALSI